MFVYLLTLLLANTCIYSFGNPVINTSETSPPLSDVLAHLADSCSSPSISSLIQSKVKECVVSPSFADKKQFGCLLLLDISSQLCNAAAANQVDIQSANLDKIKEFVDVSKLCTVAKTWNASILSQDPKYNETIDEMFKNELMCARVCGVEEITSQDSNIFCKFYKWGTEMLAAGSNQPVTAQGRINTTSGLPSGEGEADRASNSRGKERQQNEVAQLPKAPANLDPLKANKLENLPGAVRNPAIQKPGPSGNEVTNHAGLGGNSGSFPLHSGPPKASENHLGAARNLTVQKPGASGNEVTNHAGQGGNSGSLPLDSSPPNASENHPGVAINPAGQNPPGLLGNEASNHAGVRANSGSLLLDSSPPKASENQGAGQGENSGSLPLDSSPPNASENHPGVAINPAGQNPPGLLGNEASNHAGVRANSGSLLLDSSPPKASENQGAGQGENSGTLPLDSSPPNASENHPGVARNPAGQNLPGLLGNEAPNQAGVSANSGSLLLDSSPPKTSENHPGAARNTARQNLPGPSGNEASNQVGVGGNSGNALLDTMPHEDNNIGAIDYEDQPPEDTADRNSAQSLSYENDPVNVEQTSGRLSSSVSKNRLGIDDDVDEDHFFSFFLTVIIMVVLLYILYHNKNKVSKVFFGLLVEGRQGRRRNSRGHAYRRLDTLEQAMSTNSAAPPSKIIY